MNTDGDTAAAIPRWARGDRGAAAAPTTDEHLVPAHVLDALRRVRRGSIVLAVQDGRVVQVDVTEKKRL